MDIADKLNALKALKALNANFSMLNTQDTKFQIHFTLLVSSNITFTGLKTCSLSSVAIILLMATFQLAKPWFSFPLS